MPQSKDKHRRIYTRTDAGHTTLGPNLHVFYNIYIENRTSKKHDSKKDTRKNHRADFPIQIACYKDIKNKDCIAQSLFCRI